jgi:hypothetical protein
MTRQKFFKSSFLPLIFWVCCCFLGCKQAAVPPPAPTFFYWKNPLKLTDIEHQILDTLNAKCLYVKVLDVGKSPETGDIEPLSKTLISDSLAVGIVPVIFLTNETFQGLSAVASEDLVLRISEHLKTFSHLPALQLDCDWTASTRVAYFRFLKQLRDQMPEQTLFSATIRLHQYKFPQQMGVPPVDRGMLMFYNTGDIQNADTTKVFNSIFSGDEVAKYVEGVSPYPLPLDLALPIFSWALVFREGEFWKIIRAAQLSELCDSTLFLPVLPSKIQRNKGVELFRVRQATFFHGHYLRPDDMIRYEYMPPELLEESARWAAQVSWHDDAQLVFFDLDTMALWQYSIDFLKEMNQNCRKNYARRTQY